MKRPLANPVGADSRPPRSGDNQELVDEDCGYREPRPSAAGWTALCQYGHSRKCAVQVDPRLYRAGPLSARMDIRALKELKPRLVGRGEKEEYMLSVDVID